MLLSKNITTSTVFSYTQQIVTLRSVEQPTFCKQQDFSHLWCLKCSSYVKLTFDLTKNDLVISTI